MILAKIVGNVVADTKIPDYDNLKVLMFQPIDPEGNPKGDVTLGVDNCNAGIGDIVVVCDEGGSARMLMDEPSASSTAAYLEKTAMPGPMIACERSTGATGERSSPEPLVISSSASGSTPFNSRMNSRREMEGAAAARLRQTRTMLEARALAPIPRIRNFCSLRSGQVPTIAKPPFSTALRNVSHPVEDVSDTSFVCDCLKA